MPCFMAGKGAARSVAAAMGVPVKFFSHQAGHIAAVLWKAEGVEAPEARVHRLTLLGEGEGGEILPLMRL